MEIINGMQLALRTLVAHSTLVSLFHSTRPLGPYPVHLCLTLTAKINAELCPFSEANLEVNKILRERGGEGRESGRGGEREEGGNEKGKIVSRMFMTREMRELIIQHIDWGPPCCQAAFKTAQWSATRILPLSCSPEAHSLRKGKGQGSETNSQ